MPYDHPEAPERLQAIAQELQATGLWEQLQRIDAAAASFEQLQYIHPLSYLKELQAASPTEGWHALDPDTIMNPHTFNAVLRAAGAGIQAADEIMQNRAQIAFCAVRPPGHHAERAHAMGFCFINNIAVTAAHLLKHHNLSRIAILDFDVHHGNGTQNIFADDSRVLFCSTHQHPFYPYTGAAVDRANLINVPLPAGSGSREFREAIIGRWLPALELFKPEFILVSAGFDAHQDDPLGGLNLAESDYAWVGSEIKNAALRYAQGRIISCLEGGYNIGALARSVAAYIRVLL
ncbi:MAG TPA: histone deacetylase family protein [Gammaproteobacteria bacterium]